MTYPTLGVAKELISEEMQGLKNMNYNAKNDLGHCFRVADSARRIAQKSGKMNPEKAYICGLLHDYGFIEELCDKTKFHGLVGYQKLMALGYDEAARICLSHSFFEWEPIRPKDYHSYDKDSIIQSAKILSARPFDDYDRLIHISDLTSLGYKAVSLDMRFEYLAAKYRIDEKKIAHKYNMAVRLKSYFDAFCGDDIYEVIQAKQLPNHP